MDSDKKVNLTQNFKDKIEPKSQFLKKKIPGVKKIIAISSAKGGVGKSTICANLAVASSKQNLSIGLLDADIYGPSIPDLFGVFDKPTADANKKLNPIIRQNIKLISMGFLIDKNSPTQRVGAKPSEGFKTVAHRIPMLSLSNAMNESELILFNEKIFTIWLWIFKSYRLGKL